MDPLVSFVVPCYKHAHLLSQCVKSILDQTYKNYEVLIMDNCSPDNTPEIAQSFKDSRVSHIRNESNLGNVRNYNKGISLARGKYVWVVSSDDMLLCNNVVERFVEVMERNPSVGFVFCRSMEVRDGKEAGIAKWADWGDADQIWKDHSFFLQLIESNRIVASSVFVRKEGFDKAGPFQVDMPFATDWHMWCTLAMYFDVAYLSEPMVGCRFHEQSLTTLYAQNYVRICVGDEFNVLTRIRQQAADAGLPSLRLASEAAFRRRAVRLLMAGKKGETPCMSEVEFEEILRSGIRYLGDPNDIRASVYTGLADQQYRERDFAQAKGSYRLGLTARPWNLKIWTKYILLRSGVIGNRIRQLASMV
jgi:hypothetical protein